MANSFKTEAEIRAEKRAAQAATTNGAAKIDAMRKQELDGIATRLGSVTAVFQMRADSLPAPAFRRIRELMDIYISGALRANSEGQDFINQGIKLSDQESSDLHRLMRDIFNIDTGGGGDAKPEVKKTA